MMRTIKITILTVAAMLSVALTAQKSATVGIVDFYGLRQVTEAQVREALRIAEGATITESTLRSAEKRLRSLPGVSDARVDGVCCDNDKTLVYVGIAEKGTPALRFNPAPKGNARLPEEVVRAGAAFDAAFEKVVDLQEDQSQGHSLMRDPAVRAVQEGFVALADRYGQQLREALRDSDKREQRALAATAAALLIGVATSEAQNPNDAQSVIDHKANVGNRLTITTTDGTEVKGRLLRLDGEHLVLQHETGERSFRYTEIDRVRRRKNGVLLGALIGFGAGAAIGWPVAQLSSNEGGSRSDGVWIALAGLGAGVGIDALLGSNPTIYRSSVRTGLAVTPTKKGAMVAFSARW